MLARSRLACSLRARGIASPRRLSKVGTTARPATTTKREFVFWGDLETTPTPLSARDNEKNPNDEEMPQVRGKRSLVPKFRSNPRCRDGLSSWCAECHNEACRLWRRRRREAEWEAAWARQQAESERLRRYEAEWRARVAELQAERTARAS